MIIITNKLQLRILIVKSPCGILSSGKIKYVELT